MILVRKIVSPQLIYKTKYVRLIIIIINFILYSFSAQENNVITNEDIINTPDTQVQKQKKRKYYNNVSILILDNILLYT